jgi:spermidine/putrescine-binding protein
MAKPYNSVGENIEVFDNGLVRSRTMLPMNRRNFVKGGLAAGAAAATLGFGPKMARAGDTVKYMGWFGYEEAIKAGSFPENNGFELEITYIDNLEQIAAMAATGGLGHMDLSSPVNFYIPGWVANGFMEPLDTDRIPNLQGVWPALSEVAGLVVDGKQYAIPLQWGSLPLMYNADVIKEAPTSWMDMFKDEFKGKVTVTEDTLGVVYTFVMITKGKNKPWLLTRDELKEAMDLLIKFKKEHALTIASGYGELAALFESGDVIMGQSWEAVSMWMGEDAPTMKWVHPKEGTVCFVDCIGMMADSPNVDLNHKILNHMMSPEAQAYCANINATASTVEAAFPLLEDWARPMYPYENLDSFFADAGGWLEMPPFDADGTHVTYDEIIESWENFLRA